MREQNGNISQEIMMLKSEELANKLGHHEFEATRGWLHRLCKRSEIRFKKLHGEGAASDLEAKEIWLENTWPKLRESYNPEDIWNCDKSGLFYRDAQTCFLQSLTYAIFFFVVWLILVLKKL